MPSPLLEVDGLSVTFRTRHSDVFAVRDVSMHLNQGETLAVLGESGSGKSVTAMSMMGLLDRSRAQTRGQIRYAGTDLLTMPPAGWREYRGERIAMIFQDAVAALNPVMTVGGQISEVIRAHKQADRPGAKRRAIEMMERVNIPSAAERFDSHPHEFSGGMRQRIMIAMALALDPAVLIADEPTTALDVTVQAQIMQLLKDLQAENGMALLLITHDIGVSVQMADRIAVMYAGRVVETGTAAEVYANPKHPYTIGLLESMPSAHLKGQRLAAIPGNPPPLNEVTPGCAFGPRCKFAIERCTSEMPALRTITNDQLAACHRSEEMAHVVC